MTFTGTEKEILKATAQVNVTLDGMRGELAEIRSQLDRLPLQIQGLPTQQEEMVEVSLPVGTRAEIDELEATLSERKLQTALVPNI